MKNNALIEDKKRRVNGKLPFFQVDKSIQYNYLKKVKVEGQYY